MYFRHGSQIKIEGEINKYESKLINMIISNFETNKKSEILHILYSHEHYSGTGSFNVAFNYMRHFPEFENYL